MFKAKTVQSKKAKKGYQQGILAVLLPILFTFCAVAENQESKSDLPIQTEFQKALEKAKEGDSESQALISRFYFHGLNVNQDAQAAFQWAKKSADQGNSTGETLLGLCFENGVGTPKNEQEAARWFTQASEKENYEAKGYLGHMFLRGGGVSKNAQKGFQLILASAEKGYLDAMFNLGVCFYKGEGVEKNLNEALKWFRQAADQGYVEAMVTFADMHILGEGIPKDYDIGFFYLRKAADADDPEAQRKLADCYHLGIGTQPNLQKAIAWYRKAAGKGDKGAELQLGRCLIQSTVLNTESGLWMENLQEGMAILQKLSAEPIVREDKKKNFLIGQAAMEAGRFQQAKMAFSQAGVEGGPLGAQIEPDKMRWSDFKNSRNNQIVCIIGEDGTRIGSGFIYGKDGWVLTAAHVVAAGGKIVVSDGLQERWDVEGVLPGDFDSDLALLKTQIGEMDKPFPLASDLKNGETLYAVGHPLGTIMAFESQGILVENDFIIDMPIIQMPTLPGSSGSPVFNKSNELVGIAIESSYFAKGAENLRRPETAIVSYKKIKKLIDKANNGEEFYNLKAVEELSKKSKAWDVKNLKQHKNYLVGITLLSGAYDESKREEAMRILEKTAESGNIYAQAALLKEAVSSGQVDKTKKNQLMENIARESPFYNQWTNSITSRRFDPQKLLYVPVLVFCLSGYIFWKNIKFILAKKIPNSVKLPFGLFASILILLTCGVGFLIYTMSATRGYFTIGTLFAYIIFIGLLFLLPVALLNLTARGSRVGIIYLLVGLILFSCLGIKTFGEISTLRSSIENGFLALMVLFLCLGLFVQFKEKATSFRKRWNNLQPKVPKHVWLCLFFLSAFLFYLALRVSLLRFSSSPMIGYFTFAMIFGFIGPLCLLFYIGIKRGDGTLFGFLRLFAFLFSCGMALLNFGIFLSPTTFAQKLEHIGLAAFLFAALGLSFSRQTREWLAGLKSAF